MVNQTLGKKIAYWPREGGEGGGGEGGEGGGGPYRVSRDGG